MVTIGHITYEDIAIPDLDKLRGPNQFAAPLVDNLYGGHGNETDEVSGAFFNREKAATSPWKELDHKYEHENSLEHFHRHSDGWYGGRVHFTASLKLHDLNLAPRCVSPASSALTQSSEFVYHAR